MFLVQVVVGGVIGLALGYGILQLIGNRKVPSPPPVIEHEETETAATSGLPTNGRPKVGSPNTLNQPWTSPPQQQASAAQPSFPQSQSTPPVESQPAPSQPVTPAPTAQPSRAPAPMPKADPLRTGSSLANLPQEIELPSLLNTEPTPLLTFSTIPQGLNCSIRSAAADVPAGAGYLVEPVAEGSKAWIISYTPKLDYPATAGTKIARLTLDSHKLSFQWAKSQGIEELKFQLKNCLLHVQDVASERTIQLRKTLRVQQPTLNLESDTEPLAFDIPDLPKADAVLLDMEPIAQGAFRNDVSTVGLQKSIVFQFSEFAGAQVTIKPVNKRGEDRITVRLLPELEEGSGLTFELTQSKLAEMSKRWTASGQKAASSLKAAEAELENLQDARSRASSSRGGNSAEQTARQRAILGLDQGIKSVSQRIPNYRKRMLEAKARLDAAPRVESFLKQRHGTPMHFRIYAQAGDQRIMLVDTRPGP